jgi:ribose/xylose/arabinose/galactoside ABC-type transport system permease subunit
MNVTAILKTASLPAVVAVGFTLVFILGQLDLSVGAVVMLAGMLAVGFQPSLTWAGSLAVAIAAGAAIGTANGLLVAKAKVSSFIVTLGMMAVVTGLMHLYSGGGSRAATHYGMTVWLDDPWVWVFPRRVLISLALVLSAAFCLNRTRVGRGFFIVGGNPETAWLAGLNGDGYVIAGFAVCGATAAIGGGLFAMSLGAISAQANQGIRTLMTVLAAVIIGGTLMSGGKGSVIKSLFGVLLLTTLSNGIGCLGWGFEVEMFINGVVLAAVVLYEAFALHRQKLLRGRRPDLMRELESSRSSG